MNGWFVEMIRDHFTPNLLAFERHLSGLASAVCLIVESPGSMAELGAFSVTKGIAERLMVVVRQKYTDDASFIELGPLAHLKDLKPERDRIFRYEWAVDWDAAEKQPIASLSDLEKIAQDFIEDLQTFDRENPKKVSFNRETPGHVSLFLCDVIDLFLGMKLRELAEICAAIRLEMSEKNLKEHLTILDKIGLIKILPYRGSTYYVSIKDNNNYIDYEFKGAPPDLIDRNRFKFNVAELYKKADESRWNAIASAVKLSGRSIGELTRTGLPAGHGKAVGND